MSDETTDYLTCEDCGDDQITPGDEYERDGRTLCSDCDDNYTSCADCGSDVPVDDTVEVQSGEDVCDSCADNYYTCESCDARIHGDDTHSAYYDTTICDSCHENYYRYCESCDMTVAQDDDEHEHDCTCSSPAQHFSMRHGDATISNDARARLTLPAGFLSDEGVGAIARLLRGIAEFDGDAYVRGEDGYPIRDHTTGAMFGYVVKDEFLLHRKWNEVSYGFTDAIGTEWQTRQGNFTKRLSRYAHQSQGLKIPADILSQIGNIGRANSEGTDVTVEFTRDLNMSASDFYHEDSCWWQSYYESRCSLKSNGGIGMRTFSDEKINGWITLDNGERGWGDTGKTHEVVSGRAWIMPAKFDGSSWAPTFDSLDADGYVIFNGYGDLGGYTPARILAGMYGMTYRKVNFYCDPMYVNNDAGYLVTSEELAQRYNDGGTVEFDEDTHSGLYQREVRAADLVNA